MLFQIEKVQSSIKGTKKIENLKSNDTAGGSSIFKCIHIKAQILTDIYDYIV